MINSKRKEIFILLLCLLIGFALRFYTFDQRSLWMDEIYTFNDSRDDFKGQVKFYKENPTYLHPPLFFILSHQFYPFMKPERDLRIIPLIFGTLSIPMIYLLARQFSASIALLCTLSLTFMTYHVSLSQDGRCYTLLMFIGMVGLYFFTMHLKTSKKRYLVLASPFFSVLFYTSYSSIPCIALSQILWFYRFGEEKPVLSSFFTLNGLILLYCLPWIIFLISNYKSQSIVEELRRTEDIILLWNTFYGILNDWVPYAPLMIASVILLILFPFLTKNKKNALILLSVFLLPIGGLYLYCKMSKLSHFITSRYFIGFLPLFLISIYLSLYSIETKFEELKRFLRLRVLFVILFIVSSLIILPLYYRSEKQDFRGLANYLKAKIQDGDEIILSSIAQYPGILHYFGVYPRGRQFDIPCSRISEDKFECRLPLVMENKNFTVYYSNRNFLRFDLLERNSRQGRLWLVVNKVTAKKLKGYSPCVLKGYFDGSFLSFNRFPTNDSMYLFLWDPKSSDGKSIDMPTE